MTKRETVLVSILFFLLLIIALLYFKIIEFSWLKIDMGWCQKYGTGLRIFNSIIFELPDNSISFCV